MTISEVSKKYGISQDTLRYYERIGVIPPVNRNRSGLRDYTEDDCGWVELAACMRSAGLPLEALTEYVRLSGKGMLRSLTEGSFFLNRRNGFKYSFGWFRRPWNGLIIRFPVMTGR